MRHTQITPFGDIEERSAAGALVAADAASLEREVTAGREAAVTSQEPGLW